MASRPVYRGSCRMEETKVPFHPVKRGFGRRKSISTTFRPPKGGFGRTGTPVAFIARSKGRLRTGPSFCRSGPSTVSCVLLRGTCLRRTPPHYIRSAHQCAGRAVYFAAAKYGKAGRPPGVATLVAVRGLVPQDKWLAGFRKFTLAGRMA